MDLFLLYLLLLLVWNSCGNLLMAVNRHHAYSQVVFASSLLTVGLAYLGGLHYGLSGVVMGLIIGDGLVPLCLVPYLLYRYQVRFSLIFFLREVAPVVAALGATALVPMLLPADWRCWRCGCGSACRGAGWLCEGEGECESLSRSDNTCGMNG